LLAEAQRRAAERSREVVRRLKAEGLSHADVGAVLSIKPSRVSQLAR
jgi:DNA-directed RNA polymerase specialized sigma subunit